jgi:hypothetical protein
MELVSVAGTPTRGTRGGDTGSDGDVQARVVVGRDGLVVAKKGGKWDTIVSIVVVVGVSMDRGKRTALVDTNLDDSPARD